MQAHERILKRTVLAVAALTLGMPMGAQAFQWVGPVTILGYFSYDTGGTLYLRTSGTHQNPDNCTNSYYLSVDMTKPGFKELFTAIVSAQATGSTVSVNYDGCMGPYPKIISIAVPAVW